ncbi:MAG TPA: BsuPI-related putative proteinase inhibitor [Candidatus Eisenbacteria bacterium]
MPRSERSRTPLRALGLGVGRCLVFLLMVIAGSPAIARAQGPNDPPDSAVVRVAVRTDKQVYEPGEPIRITVTATNPLDRAITLTFNSTLQADYGFDNAWQWSDHRGFGDAITHVTIKANETWTFPSFTHLPADYFPPPGRHAVRGIVTGYGEAQVTIGVGGNTPPPSPLHLTPEIVPNPVPFGVPIEMFVTVTNLSSTTQTFGHSGCPVHFTVDQHYSPPVACAEYWRQVTLEAGESIRFGPPEFDYLTLGRAESGFVLTPGVHVVDFEVPGVGKTAARIQVAGGGGSISGSVVGLDGQLLHHAVVQAVTYATPDSTPWNGGNFVHQTFTDEHGQYRFDGLPSDLYFVNASYNSSPPVWYPGVPTRDMATPLPVSEGTNHQNIDFALNQTGPPPPPTKVVTGTVLGNPPPQSERCCPAPLAGAVVAAVAERASAVDDTILPPPPPDGGGSGGPPVPGDPTRPGEPWPGQPPVFYAFADSVGDFSLPLPAGRYRFVAFNQGFRYQWWEATTDWSESDVIEINPYTRSLGPDLMFTLDPLPGPNGGAGAVITGTVHGLIQADDPATGDPRGLPPIQMVPIEGADVVARPLVLDPRILWFVEVHYPVRTDADGRYRIELPADLPYVVQTWAAGWESQFYDHAWSRIEARPVDVAPGAETTSIDFDLHQGYKPPDLGVIAGSVFRAGTDDVGSNNDPARIYPVGGATVRVRLAGPGFGGFDRVAMTAEDGTFRLDGLPMADDGSLKYLVSAEAEGSLPAYFPDAMSWQEATPLAPGNDGQRSPVRIVLTPRQAEGAFFLVGVVRGDPGSGVPPVELPPWPGDDIADAVADSSGIPWWPLIGAYLYLVPADDPSQGPVAGGATSDNGTLIIPHLAPGRYKAYADHPGFHTGWFHGANRAEAAVLTVTDGEPLLVDLVLETAFPPPGSGGDGNDAAAPAMVSGLRNSPNPFKPQTTIQYRLLAPADVSVQVYDLNGRLVRTLISAVHQPAGEQFLPWDGKDETGVEASGGVYFYRVWTPVETRTGKMVMVR